MTTTINKHLLPIANRPMIFHAIEKAVEAGVQEIFINTNPGDAELPKYIGDGGHWGIKINFFEQTGGPQGIAHVVKEAERFIGDEPFLFYLSDNIFLGSLTDLFQEFDHGDYSCLLALSQVKDPERFGVPVFDEAGRLTDVWEKPSNPPNNFAVTGIYLYAGKVFFEAFENIEKSARGEYEISSIHSYFLRKGYKVGHKEITGWWKDTGKSDDLLIANGLLLDKIPDSFFPNHGSVHSGAQIQGKVRIGVGSTVSEGVKIVGPVIIGENCVLENCQIGPHVSIGQGTVVRNASIANSIILDNCEIDCPFPIKDSLVGKGVQVRKKIGVDSGKCKLILGDKTVVEFV